ncbi:MAG: Fic family protein [Thermomicrobiales bacterium]|nr:Fic family protein [Thermomicrobiales bacterium]
MRRESFTNDAPGRLVQDPEGHLAFVPDPLPPELHLDNSTVNALANAERVLGELKGLGRGLRNPHILINPFLRREAVLSSKIEGTTAGLQQLMMFEADPTEDDGRSDVGEVANYVSALELGFALLETMPICLRMIRQVHERLMRDVRGQDRRPGEFRHIPVVIGRHGVSAANARFVPPPVMEMNQALRDLERYIGDRRNELPSLIRLALVHYQFETIHPFNDGNGRIGRLLIALQLREQGILPQPLLYLSGYFEQHREEYVDLMLRTSTHGDWVAWTNFFLQGVQAQATEAVATSHELLELRDEMQNWALSASRSSNQVRLVDLIVERPVISVASVEQRLGVTPRSANDLIMRMVNAGYLDEITGQARNRRFAALQVLSILSPPDAQ